MYGFAESKVCQKKLGPQIVLPQIAKNWARKSQIATFAEDPSILKNWVSHQM
jgi:hypothetical protein